MNSIPSILIDDPVYWMAFAASAILLVLTLHFQFDHTDDWVNKFRRNLLPIFHRIGQRFGDFYAVRRADESEFAMEVMLNPDEVERRLDKDLGFERNIASSLKRTVDGDIEVGSYAYRESTDSRIPDFLAVRQVHVMLFGEDTTELYVHEEYSSILPVVGLLHYRGRAYSNEKGINTLLNMWAEQYGKDEIIRTR